MKNVLFEMCDDIIVNIVSNIDNIDDMFNFFKACPELSHITNNKTLLYNLSLLFKVPTINKLDDLTNYHSMSTLDKIYVSIDNIGHIKDVNINIDNLKRMIELLRLEYLLEINQCTSLYKGYGKSLYTLIMYITLKYYEVNNNIIFNIKSKTNNIYIIESIECIQRDFYEHI